MQREALRRHYGTGDFVNLSVRRPRIMTVLVSDYHFSRREFLYSDRNTIYVIRHSYSFVAEDPAQPTGTFHDILDLEVSMVDKCVLGTVIDRQHPAVKASASGSLTCSSRRRAFAFNLVHKLIKLVPMLRFAFNFKIVTNLMRHGSDKRMLTCSKLISSPEFIDGISFGAAVTLKRAFGDTSSDKLRFFQVFLSWTRRKCVTVSRWNYIVGMPSRIPRRAKCIKCARAQTVSEQTLEIRKYRLCDRALAAVDCQHALFLCTCAAGERGRERRGDGGDYAREGASDRERTSGPPREVARGDFTVTGDTCTCASEWYRKWERMLHYYDAYDTHLVYNLRLCIRHNQKETEEGSFIC
ncbi:hypothetical protein EVAR_38758_1 [Eumeta japonica]|uniref:Uncharacterized protein n=1 Tax=Eumeta variegata TaxID=151549 RepID=A0A4C1WML5_EUMVA|nr:hypothetical protein EVAR_38758_1 [Eumeta japonica]